MSDPFDPVDNPRHFVRECWRCGHALTHDDDDLRECPVCGDSRLVPYLTRFSFSEVSTCL